VVQVSVTVKGLSCGIHLPYEVEVSLVSENYDLIELIEHSFNEYLNSTGCSMCAAESIDSDLETYVGIFVDKFIPLITTSLNLKPKISLVNLKPLSYG
tara:strand:- start:374 stop:667 length:294 start_codon:yes stop_codon:yes gene_type:complete